MQNENRERMCLVRRAILRALKAYKPLPADLDDIKNHHEVITVYASNSELVEEWKNLTTYKYVADVAEYNGTLKFITEKGLAQINQEAERHFQIWGKIGTKDGTKD